jgi:MFS family permease
LSLPEAPSPLKRPEFRRLLAISVTVALGFGMVIPVFPLFAESFGVSLAAIGLVQLVFGSTRFAFGIVGGLTVDRFGERFCTMAGLLIVALSSYAAGFSETFLQFVLARGFGGAGSALFIAGLQNRILRIIEPSAMGRATGAFRSSFLVGIAVGPLIGGIIGESFGLAAPFHFYATGLLFATAIAYFVMGTRVAPEVSAEEAGAPAPRRSPLDALRTARPLLGDFRFVVALLATFVAWWTVSGPAQVVGALFAKNELGFSPGLIGVAVTLLSVGEVVVLFWAGKASDRYGRRAVLVPSMLIAALATGGLGQIADLSWAYFPLAIAIGASIAAASTATGGLLADSLPKGGSGAAVGVNQMAGDLGYLTAPIACLWVAQQWGYPGAYLLGALPAAAIFFVAMRLPQESAARAIEDDTVNVEPDTHVG